MTRRMTLSKNRVSKHTIILAGIAAFTVLTVWVIATRKNTAPVQSSTYQTQTKEGGNVTVIVTPKEFAAGKPAIFQIVFDTHSVDLNFNVATIAQLRDEKGNTYGVPVWSGDPQGGHHRKGALSFSALRKQTTSVTLTLKNIAGVAERTFTWNL